MFRRAKYAIPIFIAAFAGDLLTKQWVVSHGDVLIFNDRPSELPLGCTSPFGNGLLSDTVGTPDETCGTLVCDE